jgi:hypothetical protein
LENTRKNADKIKKISEDYNMRFIIWSNEINDLAKISGKRVEEERAYQILRLLE